MIYLIKTRVEPKSPDDPNVNFKHVTFEGTFIPKVQSKRVMKQKIEDQCKDFLLKNLKRDNPELLFTFKSFNITRYKNDFTLIEDKKD